MANGDAAAAAFGWIPVQSTDDIRLGYDKINQLADFLASTSFATFTSLATTAAASAAGFVAQSGFQLNSLIYQKLGKRIMLSAELNKITSALTVPSDGDIGNVNLFSLPASLTPAWGNGLLSNGGTGGLKGGYASSGGFLVLTSVAPGTALAAGTAFNIISTWNL